MENVENYTKKVSKMCKIPHFPHFDEIFSPLGVPLDLKSSVKNVLTFLCFADLQSALLCLHLSFSFVVGVGDYKSPGFNRSNLFLRRISNPPGRLTGLQSLLNSQPVPTRPVRAKASKIQPKMRV